MGDPLLNYRTPNWFYYWMQTNAGYGVTYNKFTFNGLGYTDWVNGSWVCYVGRENNNSYRIPSGPQTGIIVNGIDHFAWVCRHENRHKELSDRWFPNGPNRSIDTDGDNIPDIEEAPLGFDPLNPDTNGDGITDEEEYVYNTQRLWTNGFADQVDWAAPGHQWEK